MRRPNQRELLGPTPSTWRYGRPRRLGGLARQLQQCLGDDLGECRVDIENLVGQLLDGVVQVDRLDEGLDEGGAVRARVSPPPTNASSGRGVRPRRPSWAGGASALSSISGAESEGRSSIGCPSWHGAVVPMTQSVVVAYGYHGVYGSS